MVFNLTFLYIVYAYVTKIISRSHVHVWRDFRENIQNVYIWKPPEFENCPLRWGYGQKISLHYPNFDLKHNIYPLLLMLLLQLLVVLDFNIASFLQPPTSIYRHLWCLLSSKAFSSAPYTTTSLFYQPCRLLAKSPNAHKYKLVKNLPQYWQIPQTLQWRETRLVIARLLCRHMKPL